MTEILSTSNQIKKFLGIEPLQSISIRITMACNLKCKHCYSIAGEKLNNELTLGEIKRVIDEIRELGAVRIFFTGGEPFLRKDIVEILKYTDKNNFAMYISTNGTLLNKKIINSLKFLKHLRTLQISIDGLKKTHDTIRGANGTFDKAIHSVKLARKELKDTHLAIVSTLMKENKNDLIKLLELAHQLKVDVWALVTLYAIKRSEEAKDVTISQKHKLFQKIAKFYKDKKPKLKIGLLVPPAIIPNPIREIEYGCGYVCSFPSLLGINANGEVAPCDGLLTYKEFILGNVKEKSIKILWNHPIMKKLRSINPSDLKGVCKKCKHLTFCMGGCRARAFIEYKDFKGPYPLCQNFYDAGLFSNRNIIQ